MEETRHAPCHARVDRFCYHGSSVFPSYVSGEECFTLVVSEQFAMGRMEPVE